MFRPGNADITEVIAILACMWSRVLFNRRREPPSKTENILIGVVEGHRCNTKSIRLAPVAHDAFTIQLFAQSPPALWDANGKLCSSTIFFARCGDGEFGRCILIQQELQIAG